MRFTLYILKSIINVKFKKDFRMNANLEHLHHNLHPFDVNHLLDMSELTMFWRQEGNWCWFCRTPYFPFDLVPSCESPAGEITSATLELGRMTIGWTRIVWLFFEPVPKPIVLISHKVRLSADVHDLDQQLDYTTVLSTAESPLLTTGVTRS